MGNGGSSAEPDSVSLKSDRSVTPPPAFSNEAVTSDPRSNLLKNPRAEDGLQGWEIVKNGGDGWALENNRRPHPDNTVTKCFVTSYGECLKQQLIDLKERGYSDAFMDLLQPHIKISDWYAPRADCGSEYQICVELLDQRKNPIRTFQPGRVSFQQWNKEPWRQMTHVFKDYGPGVRFIRFTHGGKDIKFWKGWYGIRVTNSSVEIWQPAESVDHCGEFSMIAGLHKYACDLTLDPNTAHTRLILSDENRTVTSVSEDQPYPDHPERFDDVPQVLCGESLTGHCYWEAEWSGSAGISVTYKGISRKGGIDCVFGLNDKSWSLVCYDNRFIVLHNNTFTVIPVVSSSSKRAGVYVDVSAGTLSFYSVSDTHTLTHLHTLIITFTEPLYAGFGVYDDDSSVSLCDIKQQTHSYKSYF